ncbi:MAG: hypothetical protein K2F83_06960 [Oscillospiraceae bacterium]|nr:hypothetical protein [Oscillospiraceae bacterium]
MRKKRRLTRRRRALRTLAVLVFLTLYAVLPGRYYFLPSQAIQAAERWGNMGPTGLVYEFSEEGRTLRGNDRGLMVCTLQNVMAHRGWGAEYCAFLDCTKTASFHVGVCRSRRGINWYGRIDDPAATAVRLEFYRFNLGKETLEESFTIEREDWLRQDDHLYFALEFEKNVWEWHPLYRAHSELLDGEGNVIDSRDISFYGFDTLGLGGEVLYQ